MEVVNLKCYGERLCIMKYGLKTKPLQRHLNVIRPPMKQHTARNPTFEDSENGVAVAGYKMNYQWKSQGRYLGRYR